MRLLARGERRGIVWATVLFAGLLALWCVVAPPYRAADEPMHISTTLRLADSGRYPAPGRALMDPGVLASYGWVDYFGAGGRRPATVRPDYLAHAPSMRALRSPQAPRPATAIDQMTQHPPGYYLLMAGAVRLLHLQDLTPYGFVLALRLISTLLLLPLPWMCARVARRLGLTPAGAVAAAFLPAAWTQLLNTSAGVNNGTLQLLATTAALAALVPVAQGDLRLRRALGVGALVSVALLSKGFALALLPVIVVAYALGARGASGTSRGRAATALLGCLVAGLATLPGLWWWILNVVRYGTVQPSGGISPPPWPVRPPLTFWEEQFATTFSRTLWFALGWAENRPPLWLHVSVSVLFVLVLAAGTWFLRRQWRALVLLHLAWLGPLAITLLGSYLEFERSGATRGVQGRYVQVAVVGFALLAAALLDRSARLVGLVPGLVGLAAVSGLIWGVHHFWAPAPGDDQVLGRIRAMTSWWTGSTALVLVSLAAVLAAAVLGLRAARLTRAADAHLHSAGSSAHHGG